MQEITPRPRMPFEKKTKEDLCRLTFKVIRKEKPHLREFEIDQLIGFFIGNLEAIASSVLHADFYSIPKQQKRREAIRSMGSALQRFIDVCTSMDVGAKRYLFSKAMFELSKAYGEENPFPNNFHTGEVIYQNEAGFIYDLQVITNAIQEAADDIPVSKGQPVELDIAKQLESLFFNVGIPFTTSETSFSAECFRAILVLVDINNAEGKSVGYWLTQAKKNHERCLEL